MVFKVTFKKYGFSYEDEGSHFSISFEVDSIRDLITEAEVFLVENHLEPDYYIFTIEMEIPKRIPFGRKYQVMIEKNKMKNLHTDYIIIDNYVKTLKDAKELKKEADKFLKESGESEDWKVIIGEKLIKEN